MIRASLRIFVSPSRPRLISTLGEVTRWSSPCRSRKSARFGSHGQCEFAIWFTGFLPHTPESPRLIRRRKIGNDRKPRRDASCRNHALLFPVDGRRVSAPIERPVARRRSTRGGSGGGGGSPPSREGDDFGSAVASGPIARRRKGRLVARIAERNWRGLTVRATRLCAALRGPGETPCHLSSHTPRSLVPLYLEGALCE